jgi:DNA-binding transcriptional LysR family regulator
LRAFVAVCEAFSFSRAAETLGVSPSALSQLIRGLEQRVGVRLLNRTTRSVSLTEAGQALLDKVKPAVSTLGEAIDQVRSAGDRPSGIVRIHSFRSAAEAHLLPMLADFHERYPDVVLDIMLDDRVVDIVAEGYDAALRIGEVIEKDMVAVRIGEDLRQIVVASPDYIARHGAPETPRDLRNHACVRWRWPGQLQPYNWELWDGERWFAVAVDGPLIVNEKNICIEAALKGIGLAFVVKERVTALLETGRLVPLLESWSAPFPGYFVCYPEQRQMAPALRAFIDAIREGLPRERKKGRPRAPAPSLGTL